MRPARRPRDVRAFEPEAPLDLEARLVATPPDQIAKGMFMQGVADHVHALSGKAPGRGRYLPFKDYPLTEWMELIVEGARLAYPRVPVREGIRRLGQLTYSRAASSTVGKIIFSAVGRNIGAAVRLMPRGPVPTT